MGSRIGGRVNMKIDRTVLFCSMFPVQVGMTPFMLFSLVPLGQAH